MESDSWTSLMHSMKAMTMTKRYQHAVDGWMIPEVVELVGRQATDTTDPRDLSSDPAFAEDFNLLLPEQLSPGSIGSALTKELLTKDMVEIKNTPTNDHLRKLAADHPPPSQWLEGEEEKLF